MIEQAGASHVAAGGVAAIRPPHDRREADGPPDGQNSIPQAATLRAVSHALALAVSGLAVGWLIGLSVSPVIQGDVTALLALAVSVVGVMAGIDVHQDPTPGEEASAGEANTPKRLRCVALGEFT